MLLTGLYERDENAVTAALAPNSALVLLTGLYERDENEIRRFFLSDAIAGVIDRTL